jgi:hypothetical protein
MPNAHATIPGTFLPTGVEEAAMFGFAVVMLAAVGAMWLCGALIGGLFKLTFGLAGALVGATFTALAAGLVALLVIPVLLLALMPLLAPALIVAGLVWLIVRAARQGHPAPTAY